MAATDQSRARQARVFPLCDGVRTSREIAEILGEKQKYVQEVMLKFDLPRLPQAPRPGKNNPSFRHGRKIDRDGYVLASAPPDHPHARKREGRSYGIIYEHRLVMESHLGRYLDPSEVVDHIDGLRLHNCPSNLRLFDSNVDHLRTTISGQVPKWSKEGLRSLDQSRRIRGATRKPVHTYNRMKKSGDARLLQILLAAIELGIDSPYLLGSSHHLEKAGVSDFSRSSLERALADLYQRYA